MTVADGHFCLLYAPTICEMFHVLYNILHRLRPCNAKCYDMPSGFKILSFVTCAATSPPFCKAIAPITAYIVVVRTASIPDPSKFCGYTRSVTPFKLLGIERTFFGFHLIISGMPICVASLASLFFVKTSPTCTSPKFAKPSNAGCVNG